MMRHVLAGFVAFLVLVGACATEPMPEPDPPRSVAQVCYYVCSEHVRPDAVDECFESCLTFAGGGVQPDAGPPAPTPDAAPDADAAPPTMAIEQGCQDLCGRLGLATSPAGECYDNCIAVTYPACEGVTRDWCPGGCLP